MIKSLKLQDRYFRPFTVLKNWNIDLVTNPNLLLTEDAEGIFVSQETILGGTLIDATASLALEYQDELQKIQVSKGKSSPTNLFYDTGSIYYNPITNPLDWTGLYQRSIYDTVKKSFYNENRSLNLGIESLQRNPNGEYVEKRYISDEITIAKIPQKIFGEKIVPGTFSIKDYSNPNYEYLIEDDGNTNLTVINAFEISSELSQFQRITTEYYDFDNDQFGLSINANGGYLAVGSPLTQESFGNVAGGKVNIFKFDINENRYRFIKELSINIYKEERLIETSSFLQDSFGYSVSITDEFLAVGSPGAILDFSISPVSGGFFDSGSGAVAIYGRNKGGIDHWGHVQWISSSVETDRFGSDVVLDGNRLVIGAEGANGGSGLAYVYSLKTYMSADTCSFHPTESGAPYFVSGNAVWAYEGTLSPTEEYVGFGGTVAIDGDIIAVGTKTRQNRQKIFVYEFVQTESSGCVEGTWENVCVLLPSSSFGKEYIGTIQRNTSSIFGHSISINDNIIVVGDPEASSYQLYSSISASVELNPPINMGAVYVYKEGIVDQTCCNICEEFPTASLSCNWGAIQVIDGDPSSENFFGISSDIDGRSLIIGSPYRLLLTSSYSEATDTLRFENFNEYATEGVAYIYNIDELETRFNRVAVIPEVSLQGQPWQSFGYDTSIDGNFAFVSAPLRYIAPAIDRGYGTFDNWGYNTSSIIPISPVPITFDTTFFTFDSASYNLLRDPEELQLRLRKDFQGNVYTYRIDDIGEETHLGNVFYKNGLVVLTSTSSLFDDLLSDAYEVSFQSQHTIFEEQYLLTVEPGEFTVSQNPTALIQPNLIYDINGNGIIDFEDIDLILRYINKYKVYINQQIENSSTETDTGAILEQDLFTLESEFTNDELVDLGLKRYPNDEAWWNNDILQLEAEDVLLQESADLTPEFFSDNKLSEEYIEKLAQLESGGYLDINGDGVVDAYDANLILRYYNRIRTNKLVEGNITVGSTRTTADDVRNLLDIYTGINQDKVIHPYFYNYLASSSYDKTGSYLSTYVTTIGLYDDDYNMVGVAKLGTPLKILQDYPINFIVSWDK